MTPVIIRDDLRRTGHRFALVRAHVFWPGHITILTRERRRRRKRHSDNNNNKSRVFVNNNYRKYLLERLRRRSAETRPVPLRSFLTGCWSK